jgi:ATP synthase protein I
VVSDSNNHNGMHESVEVRRAREEHWRRTGERPVWRNLSMIGALGWLIVTPILLGAFIGRWLDHVFGKEVFWTGSLIFLGAVVGFYMAWQRIEKER